MDAEKPILSILVVSFNCSALLRACLSSVAANPPSCSYELVLVDNGSTDGTVAMVENDHPEVRIVANTANLGFAGGTMLAAEHARGELFLLLNPDTVVLPGAFDALMNGLLDDEQRHIAGACLLREDGSPGTSWGDFPTIGWVLAYTAPWNRLGLRMRSRSRMGSTCDGIHDVTSVGWVSGAALLVRRDVWERLGGLDTGYFMYFEETDLCHRVHEAGGDVVVVPGARIVHVEGGVIGAASLRQRVWFTESLLRFFDRTAGLWPRVVVRAWIFAINGGLWLLSWPAGVFMAHARDARGRYAALVRIAAGRPVDLLAKDGVR